MFVEGSMNKSYKLILITFSKLPGLSAIHQCSIHVPRRTAHVPGSSFFLPVSYESFIQTSPKEIQGAVKKSRGSGIFLFIEAFLPKVKVYKSLLRKPSA